MCSTRCLGTQCCNISDSLQWTTRANKKKAKKKHEKGKPGRSFIPERRPESGSRARILARTRRNSCPERSAIFSFVRSRRNLQRAPFMKYTEIRVTRHRTDAAHVERRRGLRARLGLEGFTPRTLARIGTTHANTTLSLRADVYIYACTYVLAG